MNKQDFLSELQTRIRVLAETEQRDILDEYAQHIDLKLDKGLSEDAAIADFGSLDALATEILEAYHVNPAFADQPKKAFSGVKIVSVSDPRPALKRGWAKVGEGVRGLGRGVKRFFAAIGGGVARFFRSCGEHAKAVPGDVWKTTRPKKEKKEKPAMGFKLYLQGIGRGIKRFFRALGRLLLVLLRLAWNVLLILVAAPLAVAGVLSLVCTGTLLVLLAQGYPLAGITLCCVGLVLCVGSVLVLGTGLRYRRKKRSGSPAPVEEQAAPEVVETTDLEVYHG